MAEFTKDPPFQVEAPDSKSNLRGAGVTPAAPHPPASPATAQSVWLRPFLDRLAAWIIRLGGIGVIVSILAIFVFLVIEVIPLFQRPTFSPLGQIHVTHPIADGEAIAIGVEEQMEIAYGIVPDGVFFVSLSDGAMLPVDLPASLHRLRISAVASAGGRSTRYLIGTDDGRLIPIKITFDVSTDADGHRTRHPSVTASSPIKVAPGQSGVPAPLGRVGENGQGGVLPPLGHGQNARPGAHGVREGEIVGELGKGGVTVEKSWSRPARGWAGENSPLGRAGELGKGGVSAPLGHGENARPGAHGVRVGEIVGEIDGIRSLAFRWGDAGVGIAVLTQSRRLYFMRLSEEEISQENPGLAAITPIEIDLIPGRITTLALDGSLANLYIGTDDGRLHHVNLAERPILWGSYLVSTPASPIARLGLLFGDRSLVAMTHAGEVSTWIQVRDPEPSNRWTLVKNHTLASHFSTVTAYAPSQRDKGFITGDAAGHAFLHHATSEQTLLRFPGDSIPLRAVAFAPKSNGLLTYDDLGTLTAYALFNPHPEVTLKTLLGRVWYEGYDEPTHVWQSSSGSDEFEPKLGLVPLAFGTIKGTVYALLLAIPIAILAAIFTAQFMHPDLRAKVKPAIEVMAALPTVVLGFLAGLWLAPLLERIFPALVAMIVVIPAAIVAASFLWGMMSPHIQHRVRPGFEAFLLLPIIVAAVAVCLWANTGIEHLLFGGDFKVWLSDTFGVRYDQRNAVVVGLVMGFAVIPIIYSIAEEAVSNVPRHLIAGSLALGATRWQTVAHLVLLAASPGIFSAVMIGFGRAIGETMIVLMATGNTPLMDWSAFDGFRTLSANIAVEIPEAPHGGTLYRVLFLAALLLFVMTFAFNTAAEVVRHRLRGKYGSQ